MKAKIKVEREYDLMTLKVNAGVRYWDDAKVNNVEDTEGKFIPCRCGGAWMPEINIETGLITNWVLGTVAIIHYKVCDAGIYSLYDVNGEFVIERNGYVPGCLSPKENGYGDYIIMDVNEDGYIQGWKFNVGDLIEGV